MLEKVNKKATKKGTERNSLPRKGDKKMTKIIKKKPETGSDKMGKKAIKRKTRKPKKSVRKRRKK
mgnify:CR=1 FL=1